MLLIFRSLFLQLAKLNDKRNVWKMFLKRKLVVEGHSFNLNTEDPSIIYDFHSGIALVYNENGKVLVVELCNNWT